MLREFGCSSHVQFPISNASTEQNDKILFILSILEPLKTDWISFHVNNQFSSPQALISMFGISELSTLGK
jgi:hypothetical protein